MDLLENALISLRLAIEDFSSPDAVFSNLSQFEFREKPQGTQPLSKDEFRCFGCGGAIKYEDESCPLCGWSWK
jgi:rubrerythrin